jgi:hypothetical protein
MRRSEGEVGLWVVNCGLWIVSCRFTGLIVKLLAICNKKKFRWNRNYGKYNHINAYACKCQIFC